MVIREAFLLRGRVGKSSFGNLLLLAALVVVGYYGVGAGEVYLRYWRMKQEMRAQARMAPGRSDEVINNGLIARATQLGLPSSGRAFVIYRTPRPYEIVIRTTWKETLKLPFKSYVITLRPEVREQLRDRL